MEMVGRTYSAVSGYRYGFNGKEKDKDMHSLTAYDYGFRIYNPAIGKFLSVDPLSQSYPWNSPYSYAEGDVIRAIDVDGLEKLIVIINKDKFGRTSSMVLTGVRDIELKEAVDANLKFVNKKDVTERDVLIITKQEGKADMLSYSNLNDNYRKQIKNASRDNSLVDDKNMQIPKGAKGAIAMDENYRNQVLKGEATYDDSKYEAFKFEQKFKLSKPIEYSEYYLLEAGDNKDSPEKLAEYNINGKGGFNDVLANFNTKNPGVTSKIIKVTITGLSKAKANMEAARKELLKSFPNAIIKMNPLRNYDHIKNGGNPTGPNGLKYSQDAIEKSFRVDVKVSGVK